MTRHKLANPAPVSKVQLAPAPPPDIHSLLRPLAQDLEKMLSAAGIAGQVTLSKDSTSQHPCLLSSTHRTLLGQLVSTVKPQPLSLIPHGFPASLSLPRLPLALPTLLPPLCLHGCPIQKPFCLRSSESSQAWAQR